MRDVVRSLGLGFSLLVVGIAIVGCGGGGKSSSLTPTPSVQQPNAPQAPGAVSVGTGTVSFTISIPSPSPASGTSSSRRAQYVSPSTQSVQILTTDTNQSAVANVPSGCLSSPPYFCSVQISLTVPAGPHQFTISTFDQPNAQGHLLSTNSTGTVNVSDNSTTFVPITLLGVVAQIVLTLQNPSPPVGTAASIPLTVVLKDAGGNIVVGAEPFNNPVTLTTTDATNGALSKTVLNSPADASGITVQYSGANIPSITFSATASGNPAVTNAVLTPASSVTSSQRIYVYDSSRILEYAADANGNVAPVATISGPDTGLAGSGGLAVDATGKIYAANPAGNSVTVYAAGATGDASPNATISGTDTGLTDPGDLTVDTAGKIYVIDGLNVLIFSPGANGNVAPSATISLPVGSPGVPATYVGVAVDSVGRIYVSSYFVHIHSGGVDVFAAGANGAAPPLSTTSDSFATTGGGLALDATGKLYLSSGPGSAASYGFLSVFSVDANGTLTQSGGFGGSNTGLFLAHGVSVDPTGKTYVINSDASGQSNILVFAAGASGNAAPIATISGSNTGLDNPLWIAVR